MDAKRHSSRWLAIKLAVVGLASMAVAGLRSLMVTWWASPIDTVNANRFSPGTFDERGIVAIGYAAFAFVLAVTAGMLIRRTLPAMATTLAVFVTARLAFIHSIRPHLAAPAQLVTALNPLSTGYGSSGSLFSRSGPSNLQPVAPNIPNAWITSNQVLNTAGHPLTPQILTDDCPSLGTGGRSGAPGTHSNGPVPASVQQTLHDCVAKVGATYHQVVAYQPANRYWTFQWYELAIFVGAALVVAGVLFGWIRRRLA